MGYIYMNLLTNLFRHPFDFCRASLGTIKNYPQAIHSVVSGFDIARRNVHRNEEALVGVYFRNR
jgi:hypothetical protein